MKKLGYFAMLVLAVAPVMAATSADTKTPGHVTAVSLAAKGSKASIRMICNAVYKAVQTTPQAADLVLGDVLAQRDNWSPEETYAIFSAVLMAHPDVEMPYNEHAGTADASSSAAPVTVMDKLVSVLQEANLPEGTFATVMESAGMADRAAAASANAASAGVEATAADTASLLQVNQNVVNGALGGSSLNIKDLITPPAEDIPTPAPMSPQN